MLGRDTGWRQGGVLCDDAALGLGLVEAGCADRHVIVISHDCDLVNEGEPFVEVIVGLKVGTADAMLSNARNPRRLHVKLVRVGGEDLYIELRHADRKQVSKSDFARLGGQAVCFLDGDEKHVLKQWLAARYGRPSFPNAFEARLRKSSVERRIAKLLTPAASHLVALLFDLGENRSIELPEGEPYFLSISIVYDASEGGKSAREAAAAAALSLTQLFETVYGAPDAATDIALENCTAVADTLVTLADLRKVDQWRLEYISLAQDPPDYCIPAGGLPS